MTNSGHFTVCLFFRFPFFFFSFIFSRYVGIERADNWCGGNILVDLNSRRELTYKSTMFPSARSTPYACSWDVKVHNSLYTLFSSVTQRTATLANTLSRCNKTRNEPLASVFNDGLMIDAVAVLFTFFYVDTTGGQELPSRAGDDEDGRTQSTG